MKKKWRKKKRKWLRERDRKGFTIEQPRSARAILSLCIMLFR